jgi:acyl-coenzyme A synthetase/AMP-(fatty) acid ligase/acyl carrier protein
MSDFFKKEFTLPPRQQAIRDKCFHPSGTFVEFPIEDVETSIPARFEKIVQQYPERLAVKIGERGLTYNQLNDAANRVARAILEKRGVGIEPVALLFEQGLDAIISYLGTLKAGKILVFMDASLPVDRIIYTMDHSGAAAIVTGDTTLSLANTLNANKQQIINVDAFETVIPSENLSSPSLSPIDVSQIVYSSGSTGKPKGIFFDHLRVLHDVMMQINLFRICPDDRIIDFRTLSFGAGFKSLLKAVLSGAAFFPYDVRSAGVLPLAEFLKKEGITIFSPGISVFREFSNNLTGKELFPRIRIVTLGGESILPADIESYKQLFAENCLLVHGLSSSEAGLVCYNFIDQNTALGNMRVPVGYSVQDKKVFLVNDTGTEVPRGQVGEIAVQSRYLSSGYWRDTELSTNKVRFLADPGGGNERILLTGDLGLMGLDGSLIHMGRKDFMIKIRGYRVEIGEIEQALLLHPHVVNAGVADWERESGDKFLVGYIVARATSGVDVSDLNAFLRDKLPDYMIPSAFIFLDSLPLTNGKLDRRALPKPNSTRPNLNAPFVAPHSDDEKTLANIWSEILDICPIGMDDNFFDLGGHSLAATRIITRVIQTYQLELPLKALFDAPTVAEMAVIIEQHQHKQATDVELARMLAEVEALSDSEAQQQLTPTDGEQKLRNDH